MRKIGNFIKRNMIGFIVGVIIAGTIGVYAATIVASNIPYDNTTSGLTATNAQSAIDEMFSDLYGGNFTVGSNFYMNGDVFWEKQTGERLSFPYSWFKVISNDRGYIRAVSKYCIGPYTLSTDCHYAIPSSSSVAEQTSCAVSTLSDLIIRSPRAVESYVRFGTGIGGNYGRLAPYWGTGTPVEKIIGYEEFEKMKEVYPDTVCISAEDRTTPVPYVTSVLKVNGVKRSSSSTGLDVLRSAQILTVSETGEESWVDLIKATSSRARYSYELNTYIRPVLEFKIGSQPLQTYTKDGITGFGVGQYGSYVTKKLS